MIRMSDVHIMNTPSRMKLFPYVIWREGGKCFIYKYGLSFFFMPVGFVLVAKFYIGTFDFCSLYKVTAKYIKKGGIAHNRINKYDFKRRFSINVYRLDKTVSLWKQTVSRNYWRASTTSGSGSRYSGVFLPINKHLRRSDACIASQGHFQHFL